MDPAATRHTRPGQERSPSPSRDPSMRLAARRIAQLNTALPQPGPGGHARRGSAPGAQRRGLTPQPRRPAGRHSRTRNLGNPDGPGRAIQARYQGKTTPKSIHSCRSSADPGPPQPGPADYALQGRPPGPGNRPAGPGRPRKHGPKWATVSNSFHRCRSSADPGPPLPGPVDLALQGLSCGPAIRPTPGAGDATPKLHARARHELRRSSPLEHRHSDCTGPTVPSGDSDTPPRAQPPGPDADQSTGSRSGASPHHPPRARTINPTKHPRGQSPAARTKRTGSRPSPATRTKK
jgi:hypothetical protein